MHGLIPRAVEEALQERGIEPVDTPNIKDVALEEGQPLKFTAAIETVPPFDPGDLSADLAAAAPTVNIDDAAVDETLRAASRARGEVRAGRRAARRRRRHRGRRTSTARDRGEDDRSPRRRHRRARRRRQPARLRREPRRAERRATTKTFTIHFPEDYGVEELAGTPTSTYTVTVKEIRTQGAAGARRRVREGPGGVRVAGRRCGTGSAPTCRPRRTNTRSGSVRTDLLKQLARAGHLRAAGVAGRARDRPPARGVRPAADAAEHRPAAGRASTGRSSGKPSGSRRGTAVASALVLDEIARRENITVATGRCR